MADLLPVDDAIARIVAGVAPLAAETVRSRRRRSAGRSPSRSPRGAPSRRSPPRRWTATPSAPPTSPRLPATPARRRHGRRRRRLRRQARPRRSRPHLHRRAGARRRRRRPHPGKRRRDRCRDRRRARPASQPGDNIRPAGLDFREGATLLAAGRTLAMREIALAAAMGHAALRCAAARASRSSPPATNSCRPARSPARPDRRGQRARHRGLCPRARRRAARPRHRPRRHGGARRRHRRAARPARRYSRHARRRLGRRPRPRRRGARRQGHGARLLADRHAPGQAADVRPLSAPMPRARPPGQPGVEPRLRAPVPAAADRRPARPPASDPSEPAILGVDVPANDGRQDYVRATLVAGRRPAGGHAAAGAGSSMLSVLAAADCLLVRAPNAPAAKAGEPPAGSSASLTQPCRRAEQQRTPGPDQPQPTASGSRPARASPKIPGSNGMTVAMPSSDAEEQDDARRR